MPWWGMYDFSRVSRSFSSVIFHLEPVTGGLCTRIKYLQRSKSNRIFFIDRSWGQVCLPIVTYVQSPTATPTIVCCHFVLRKLPTCPSKPVNTNCNISIPYLNFHRLYMEVVDGRQFFNLSLLNIEYLSHFSTDCHEICTTVRT